MNGSTSCSAKPETGPQKPDDSSPVRFTLTGPSRNYDPLHQAIRRDLADVAEADHHFAPHYADPILCKANGSVDVHADPLPESAIVASLADGGHFALLDLTGGWAWGYAVDGHIVGYVRRERIDIA